jgi:hypothetical protein
MGGKLYLTTIIACANGFVVEFFNTDNPEYAYKMSIGTDIESIFRHIRGELSAKPPQKKIVGGKN